MNIKIRQGRRSDAKLIAWTMLMAGRCHLQTGIWDILIAQPEKQCLEYLEKLTLHEPRHMCSYTEFLVAEVNGKPIAALEGYDPVKNGEETMVGPMSVVSKEMGFAEAKLVPGEDKLTAFLTCHIDVIEGAWVVEHVATLPEYRRMGVISKLLEAMFEKARQQGFHKAQLSYYIGNIPGERAYEKAGFGDRYEVRHPDFEALIGSPGMVRLVREL